MLLILSDKGKGMQSSSEQPLVGEEHCVTTLTTAAKETNKTHELSQFFQSVFQKRRTLHISLLNFNQSLKNPNL